MKKTSNILELEFLTTDRSPSKRKSSDQSLVQKTDPKRRSNLRHRPCENVPCKRMRDQNEELKTENSLLKATIEQNEKIIADLKDQMNESNVSDLSMRLSQARIKGSQRQILDGSQNKLFKVEINGAIKHYSVSIMVLGLTMLVLLNIPANCVPSMLLLAYSSAGFQTPNLPKYNFFRRLRFMLVPLNEIMIRQFLADAIDLSIAFDETTLSTKLGHALAITVMDHTGTSKVLTILEHEEKHNTHGSKAEIDVEVIMKALRSICEDESQFKAICKKIKSVLTDNSRSANASNQALCHKLDELAPLETARKSLKCTVHQCGLLDKHSLTKLPLITPFVKKVAAHFAPPSGLAQDNLYQLWKVKSKSKFLISTGQRFFFIGNNALIAFLEYDKLYQIVEENQAASNGAKEIFQLMKNPKLKEELTLMAGLACLIRQIWTHLTIKTTRAELASKINMLYDLVMKIENGEANIIDTIKNANSEDENVKLGRELFLSELEDNDEKINVVKEIYLYIVKNMRPFLEPFTEVDEGTEENLIDPTNIPCERVFGLFKYAEKHLGKLQFGLLANHAIAKFNRLDLKLDSLDPEQLEKIHSEIPKIEKLLKQQEREQEEHKLEAARRQRDQVTILVICLILIKIQGSNWRTKIFSGIQSHTKQSKPASTTRFVRQNHQTAIIEQKLERMLW